MVLPFKILSSASSFSVTRSRWRSLTVRAARTMGIPRPYSCPVATSAAVSFPKHEPPQPMPACKKLLPMRASLPMPREIWPTSAPTLSASSAISLMKLILSERNALAAYLMSSADARSVVMRGTAARPSGRRR